MGFAVFSDYQSRRRTGVILCNDNGAYRKKRFDPSHGGARAPFALSRLSG
jgi:hypothetical protein